MSKDNLVNINDHGKKEAIEKLLEVNKVDGFDPTQLAIPLDDGKYWLQVIYQLGWFRLKHPDGRIAVDVSPLAQEGSYTCRARVYADKKDEDSSFLAEATASRAPDPNKPEMSAREWAQTAAVGVALRFAGFGLPFDLAGDGYGASIPDELGETGSVSPAAQGSTPNNTPESDGELTLDAAMAMRCPVKRFSEKTLGDLIRIDPKCLTWISEKSNDPTMKKAAQLIIDRALQQAS